MDTKSLFALIKSMTATEKRYHRLATDLQNNSQANQASQLFNLMAGMRSYDKAVMADKMDEAGLARNANVLKFKLGQQILRSLRVFHEGNSNRMSVLQNVLNIEILYKRGLYQQAFQILEKTQKMALIHQDTLMNPVLAQWEIELHRALFYTKIDLNYLDKWSSDLMKSLKDLQVQTKQQELHGKIYLLLREHGIVRSEELEDKMTFYLNQILELEKIEKSTLETKRLEYMVRLIYHYARHETNELFDVSQKLSNLFLDNQSYASEHPDRFIAAMNNYAIALSNAKLDHLVPLVVEQIREVNASSAHEKMLLFISSTILELNYFISLGNFERGMKAAEQAGRVLKSSRAPINEDSKIHLLYNIAFVNFGAGEYLRAVDWIQKIMQSPGIKHRNDIAVGAQILEIVVQLELKNNSVVESRAKSLLRKLSIIDGEFRFEKMLVTFLERKVLSCKNASELQAAYLDILEKLKEVSKDRMEKIALKGFDYISWLESKVTGRNFGKILAEKHRL